MRILSSWFLLKRRDPEYVHHVPKGNVYKFIRKRFVHYMLRHRVPRPSRADRVQTS